VSCNQKFVLFIGQTCINNTSCSSLTLHAGSKQYNAPRSTRWW
jgi:hypothetical protein